MPLDLFSGPLPYGMYCLRFAFAYSLDLEME